MRPGLKTARPCGEVGSDLGRQSDKRSEVVMGHHYARGSRACGCCNPRASSISEISSHPRVCLTRDGVLRAMSCHPRNPDVRERPQAVRQLWLWGDWRTSGQLKRCRGSRFGPIFQAAMTPDEIRHQRGTKMTFRLATVTCVALLLCQSAFADEAAYRTHRHRHYAVSPHVVELVTPPYSGRLVINGFRYDGVSPACLGWVPGQPVRLVSGSWVGECDSATFYNVSRRNACQTVCRGRAWWW